MFLPKLCLPRQLGLLVKNYNTPFQNQIKQYYNFKLHKVNSNNCFKRKLSGIVDKLKKSDQETDKLLFSCNASLSYMIFNTIGLAGFSLVSYAGYKVYIGDVILEENEDNEVMELGKKKRKAAIYSNFNLQEYRPHVAALLVGIGLSFFLLMLRFTLRSIKSLVLLKDGKTLQVTTSSIVGTNVTKTIPFEHVYATEINDAIEGTDHTLVEVKDWYLYLILPREGTCHNPYLLRNLLGIRKSWVRD